MIRWTLSSFFAFIAFVFCDGQVAKGHYLTYHLGYAYQVVKDGSLSPVSYSGHLGNLGIGFKSFGKRWNDELELHGSGGILSPDVNPEAPASALLIGGRLNYRIGYRLLKRRKWQLHGGLSSINIWDYRDVRQYANNNFNFNGFFALGLHASAQRHFTLFAQNFTLQYQLALPLVGYVLRPGYIKPSTAGETGYKSFESWQNLFMWENKTELYWQLSAENYLALAYRWEYAQLELPNKIQLAQHYIHLSFISRL